MWNSVHSIVERKAALAEREALVYAYSRTHI